MTLSAQNGVEFQWRQLTNGESSYVQGPYLRAPSWVRLTRTNNLFTGWHSDNGTNWTQLGSPVSINMPNDATIGLAVTAVNNSGLNTSTLDSVRIYSAATLDTDGDGMPDSYELANSFNPNSAADAAQDADVDRMTNMQEYWVGTNPRSAASVLRITSLNRMGNNLVLSFSSGIGKVYTLERAVNAPAAPWQAVTNVGPFTNGSATITNTGGATSSNSFYRLRFIH
jgi:hypothetical protein